MLPYEYTCVKRFPLDKSENQGLPPAEKVLPTKFKLPGHGSAGWSQISLRTIVSDNGTPSGCQKPLIKCTRARLSSRESTDRLLSLLEPTATHIPKESTWTCTLGYGP